MEAIWMQYGCSIDVVWMQYGCSMDAVRMQYGGSMEPVWMQYGCSMQPMTHSSSQQFWVSEISLYGNGPRLAPSFVNKSSKPTVSLLSAPRFITTLHYSSDDYQNIFL